MIPKALVLWRSTLNAGLSRLCSRRCYSTEVPSKDEPFDITTAEETPRYIYSITEEEEEDIMKKRLKSRLNDAERRHLQGVRPYDESMAWFHDTIRYKKRMLGRYGMSAMTEKIGLLWPTKEEVEDKILFEKTAYPKSLQERLKEIEERNIEQEKAIRLREEQITKSLAMVAKWEKDMKSKLAKKEADLLAAKERRMRLVEEVRRQFGFAIDPRDERFKQLLEQKEKEDKKRKKELKKKEKAAKFLASMANTISMTSSEMSPTAEVKESPKPVQKESEKEF